MPGPDTSELPTEPPDKREKRGSNVLQENVVHISDDEQVDNSVNCESDIMSVHMEVNNNPQQKTLADNLQKNSITHSTKSKFIDINNRYAANSPGPFVIYVEHLSLNVGRLHPMRLGEKLLNIGDDATLIKEINVIGRNRVKIEVQSASAANRLVKNTVFSENELISYIPLHLTEKRGIIRGVDTSYSEAELLDLIQSHIPIKNIRRLYRYINKDGQMVKSPRQMIVVTFNKLEIPQFIYINKVRFEVNCYYSPVILCYNCLRYGHTSKQCKSSKKCQTCGSETEQCSVGDRKCSSSCSKFCIHCRSNNHNTTDRSCPLYLKQKRIKECMAHLNISFTEAQKAVDNPSYASLVSKNKFAPLISHEEFPELPIKTTSGSYNKSKSINTSHSQSTASFENSTKKRKVRDTSPEFHPIQREFPWSFGGKPIINTNSPPQNNFEALKHRLMIELGGYFTELCKTCFNLPTQQEEVMNHIGSSVNQMLSNVFNDFHVQSQY